MPDIDDHSGRFWYLLDPHGQLVRVSASSRSMGQITCVSTYHDFLKLTRRAHYRIQAGRASA